MSDATNSDVSMLPFVSLAGTARRSTLIYPATEVVMPHVLVHDNLDDGMRKLISPAYAERIGRPGDVSLVELPPGARLLGSSLFMLVIDGQLVLEQVQPRWRENGVPANLQVGQGPVTQIDDEVMLIARYGQRTWGHWLGELLPKIAVCEQHFPGRFRYAVQNDCLASNLLGQRLMESIAAYGVTAGHLLPVSKGEYRFARLFAMTPVWNDRMMHPSVMSLMQALAPARHDKPVPPRIALLREDNARRQMTNAADIARCLRDNGFHVVDMAKSDFAGQVALFSGAKLIFSILGSSLSGLIYAQPGIGVISAAPARFADRFFYALMQAKGARYADLRGPVVGAPLPLYRDSPFSLAPEILQQCIDVMTAPRNHAG